MFDKPAPRSPEASKEPSGHRIGPEDERIALRCNRRELQLLDSFVASGEFRSRSELMRSALQEFLRARAAEALVVPAATQASGLVEVPVRLRREEVETFASYAEHVANGQPLADVLAELVRRGEVELKVSELAKRSRQQRSEADQARASASALGRSGEELARRGVVGR